MTSQKAGDTQKAWKYAPQPGQELTNRVSLLAAGAAVLLGATARKSMHLARPGTCDPMPLCIPTDRQTGLPHHD